LPNLYNLYEIRPYLCYFSMDGVFLMKRKRWIGLLICLVFIFTLLSAVYDKQQLRDRLIRLHVVANSDSEIDQSQKMQVRDAVISYLQPQITKLNSKKQAYAFIEAQLQNIEHIANQTLQQLGATEKASVSMITECYDTRIYDTFSLPAGVYDSLKVEIGNHEGKNWWCVVFPSLCLPATTGGFQDVAVSSGFNPQLVDTISSNRNYDIRFFLLDFIGKIENFFYDLRAKL